MRTYPTSPAAVIEAFPEVMRAHLHWQADRFRQGTGQFLVARSRLGRDLDSPHYHTVPEVFFQLCGETQFFLPGRRLRVPEGSMCLIPTGIPHIERLRRDQDPADFANAVLICMPPGLSLHLALARRHESGGIWPYGHQGWRLESDDGLALLRCLRSIEEGIDDVTPGDQLVQDGFVLAALGLLDRVLSRADEPLPRPARCQRVSRHILQHIGDPDLSVAGLATGVDCHPDHLSREFRDEYGMSLNRYINHQRIELAQHLLVRNTESIAIIARRVGYADPAYFARVFRRLQGSSPREYRRRHAV